MEELNSLSELRKVADKVRDRIKSCWARGRLPQRDQRVRVLVAADLAPAGPLNELRRLIAAARSDKWRPEMRRYLWKDALPTAIQAMLACSFADEDAFLEEVVAFLRECMEHSVRAIEDDRAEEAAILAVVLVPGARLYLKYGQPSGADTSHVEEERALRGLDWGPDLSLGPGPGVLGAVAPAHEVWTREDSWGHWWTSPPSLQRSSMSAAAGQPTRRGPPRAAATSCESSTFLPPAARTMAPHMPASTGSEQTRSTRTCSPSATRVGGACKPRSSAGTMRVRALRGRRSAAAQRPYVAAATCLRGCVRSATACDS